MVETIDLGKELVDDAMVMSPVEVGVADLRIDKLTGHLASTRSIVISLASKLYGLENVRDKAKIEHEERMMKVLTEAKKSKDYIESERDGARFCYHGVLWSIWAIVIATCEQNSVHPDTLFQLRLLFE